MKYLLTALILTLFADAQTLEEAKAIAAKDHRAILLTFSGSDWCVPCIRMEKDIFQSSSFRQLADSSLVLLNADFPRMSKNKLPPTRQKTNESLAERYNPGGKFPLTLLLDTSGRVIQEWDGFPGTKPAAFCEQIAAAIKPLR